jgi:hypothetical protein
MAQELVYYSLKFSVLVNCKEADTSSRLLAVGWAMTGSAGPGPAPRHELELFFTIQDKSVVVSLESVWDIVCGRGRDNRTHKFNRQAKRLFATTFGTEADAQSAIEAWPDKSAVPMHIAVACLISRAPVACVSNDLALDDYYLQLSHVAAHLLSLREQDHDADARSTVRSDAIEAPPPATAGDLEADQDEDEDQGTDADADQDDGPQVADADAVQDAEPLAVDEERGSLADGDHEMAADANGSHEQRVDRLLTEHAVYEGNADVEADGDGSQPDCNDEDGTEEQAADEGDAADVDVTGGDPERHDQAAATSGKRASPSSSDLRDTESKCARTMAPAVDDSASDSEAEAVLADANRDSNASDVTPIDLAQHLDDLCSIFMGAAPEAVPKQNLESHLGPFGTRTGPPVTPAQHVGVSCAKMARKFQELLQQLPKKRRAAGAMSAEEIEEFSEMASGALTA